MATSVNHEKSASRIQFLDGLRGVAALAVVFAHCLTGGNFGPSSFRYIGTNGVWAFFVLSSFLLTFLLYRRLVADRRANHPIRRTLGEYAIRRFMRVYPLYFIVSMFLKLAPSWAPHDSLGPAFHNCESLLLIRSPSLAWTIPVEMQSYLILPVIVFAVYYAGRLWILPTLVCVMYAYVYSTSYMEFTWHTTPTLRKSLPVFLYGAVAGIVCIKLDEFFAAQGFRLRYPKLCSKAGIIVDFFCWVLFAMFSWISVPDFNRIFGSFADRYDPRYQAPICASLLCLAMLSQRSFTKFFEWSFFVHCGKVSFAMYLTHYWPARFHHSVLKWYGYEGTIAIILMVVALSTIIYWTIEVRIQKASSWLIKRWYSWS